MMIYNWFARAYNWSPSVVDGLALDEVEWLPLLAEGIAQATETIQKEIDAQR